MAEQAAHFVDAKHGVCKAITGHQWEVRRGRGWLVVERGYLKLVADCLRCTAERVELVDMHRGSVKSRYYVYPEGYVFDYAGKKHAPRTELRLEAIGLLAGKTFAKARPERRRRKRAA
jgi:hypothetical protein